MTTLKRSRWALGACVFLVASASVARADTVDAGVGLVLPTELPSGVIAEPGTSPDDPPIVAEPVAPPKDEPEVPREVVVTGSRIRRKDLQAMAPLAVFTREQIAATGRSNVAEFLQTMPEASNAINRATNNGGDGSLRVNLRGINPASTLVLLNGRRLTAGGTGANSSVDLSMIPTNVIERIEVLKDGASAIYGSDAIAGVVNLITRKKISGAEAVVYGSTTTYGDGQQLDVSGIVGTTGEKGSAFLSANFYTAAPVYAGNRAFSKYQLQLFREAGKPDDIYRIGSGTIPAGRVVIPESQVGLENGNDTWNALVRANPTAGSFIRGTDGSFRPFEGTNVPEDMGDGWNFQPYNYLVTPQQRFNIFSSGEYQLGTYARVFYDALYSKRTSQQLLAPEPLLTDIEGVTVSAANVYNPFGRDFDAVRRRLVEFGGRKTTQDINNVHVTMGIDGDLPEAAGVFQGFHWEGAFIFSRNDSTDVKEGNIRLTRLQSAVGPSFVDSSGVARCGTAGAPIAGCVPLNLFGGPGSITKDQLDYLTFIGTARGYNQLIGGQANVTGDLFRIAAERKVAIAFGYDGRVLSGGNVPDPITVAGETSGNKGLITEGSYSVHEGYGELTIPIVDKLPGADLLEAYAAVRVSSYSSFGATANYKLGGRYRPIRDVTIRGSYSTSFRAPTVPELFGGQSDNFAYVADPCANAEAGSVVARNCGAAAGNGDDQDQLRSRVGGNTALKPEVARTFTVGTVIEPRFLKGFALTVDYWNTDINNTISSVGENVILEGCYPGEDGKAPQYCALIQRDPTTQRISQILNLNANVGRDSVDGLDVTGSYDLSTPIGRFNVLSTFSYLNNYKRVLADGTVVQGAGTWDLNVSGSGGAFPRVRFMAGLNWRYQGFSAGVRTYVIGSFDECSDADGAFAGDGLCYSKSSAARRTVDAWNNWDANVGYQFTSPVGRTSLTLGVTNLFNQTPPLIYNGFGNTTDTYNYDLVLRQVFFRVAQNF
ncbi:MAG: TonB-dependent receptor [Myxococcales bacterium]|nr:TonB-dependent receptor [Myxococcales bacterium]